MSNYVPPHRRKEHNENQIKLKKKEEEHNNEYPEINRIEAIVPVDSKLRTSFADIIEKEEKEEVYNLTDNIKPGWSVIRKANVINNPISSVDLRGKNRNTTIIYAAGENKLACENDEEENNKEENVKSLELYDKMLKNWDNFRDLENELQGDISRFHNYKEELEKMREENIYLEERMEEYSRMLELADSDSEDDERYRY